MASLRLVLAVYIFGGITFLPLVVGLVLLHAYLTLPSPVITDDQPPSETSAKKQRELSAKNLSSASESKAFRNAPDVAAGYFAVSREYVPGGTNGKPPERTTSVSASVTVESPSVYQTMYRSIFDRTKGTNLATDAAQGRSQRGRNIFYVVLRHGHLMLYDDAEQLEIRQVISLAHYRVDVYAGGAEIPEGELWIKRNCIRLSQRSQTDVEGMNLRPFYMFSDNCSSKEDFYHALLQGQEYPEDLEGDAPSALKFEVEDLLNLVQQLHTSEDNSATRWINALIGRLFLALYKTEAIKNNIWAKFSSKIARVPKPAFITAITIQRIDMGNLPPFITNPRLKELNVEGDLTIEADVSYRGNFRLDVAAIARIELGTRFKAREVTLVLATILKRLDGHILIRMKPPPSNRLWVSFETAPKMELSLEPIVSSRQITYGVILRAIESRIREVVNETLVLPNWDDFPFSNSASQPIRGGIWASSKGKPSPGGILAGLAGDVGAPPRHSDSRDDLENVPSVPSAVDIDNLLVSKGDDTSGLRRIRLSSSDVSTEDIGVSSAVSEQAASSHSPFVDVVPPAVDGTSEPNHGDKVHTPKRRTTSKSLTLSSSPPPAELSAYKKHTSRRSTASSTDKSRPPQIHKLEDHPTPSSPAISISSAEHLPPSTLRSPIGRGSPIPSPTPHSPQTFEGTRSPLLNHSLTTATAMAKKWLGSRDTAHAPSSFDPSSHDADDASATPTMTGSTVSLAGPMGRGQPLPPPGTPLPLPPRVEKRNTWSVPLAGLARRKVSSTAAAMGAGAGGEKQGIGASGPGLVANRADGSAGKADAAVEKTEVATGKTEASTNKVSASDGRRHRREAARRRSSVASKTGSALSDGAGFGRNGELDGPPEDILIVAAPALDASRPVSPEVEDNSTVGEVDRKGG